MPNPAAPTYEAAFGPVTVRFVRSSDGARIPFIPVDDAVVAISECAVGVPEDVKDWLFRTPLRALVDGCDKDRFVDGDTILPTISLFAFLDLLNGFDGLEGDECEGLRETARHVVTLRKWLLGQIPDASDALNVTVMDVLKHAIVRADREEEATAS